MQSGDPHGACPLQTDLRMPARCRAGAIRFPVVIKADGLAAGKGVIIVAGSPAEADAALATLEPRLVIEEFLSGEEVSFIVLSDGRHVVPLEATQDHKAVCDGDTGPNTGGMGAYCDGRILTVRRAAARFSTASCTADRAQATGFTGFLYAGLMMTADGPKVLEFNVAWAIPKTQPLMHRLQSDFGDRCCWPRHAVHLEGMHARLEAGAFGRAWSWRRPAIPAGPNRRCHRRDRDRRSLGATVFQAGTKSGIGRIWKRRAAACSASPPRDRTCRSAIDNSYAAVSATSTSKACIIAGTSAQKGLKRQRCSVTAIEIQSS